MIKHLKPKSKEELSESIKNLTLFEQIDFMRETNFSKDECKIVENKILGLIDSMKSDYDDVKIFCTE